MVGNNGIIVLQRRDLHLFTELAIMLVADREQVKCAAGFGSTGRTNARLLALVRAGFLRRYFIGASGAARKALYSLSRNGALAADVPYRGIRRANGETLVADFALTHQLRINDVYCLLKYQPIPFAGAQFSRWVNFQEPVDVGIALIPDGYAEVTTPDRTVAMFFEIDLGHENGKVWRRKVTAYVNYATSGKFQSRFGQPQFRTLVLANSERRMASLRRTTATVTGKIFRFGTLDAIRHDLFWSPIWLPPTGDQRQSILQRP